MKKFYLLFLLISLITGCGASLKDSHYEYSRVSNGSRVIYRVIPVYIDKTFGEQDKLALDDAIRQWNYVLNRYIELRVMSTSFDMEIEVLREAEAGRALLVMKVFSDNSQIPESKGFRTLAWVNTLGGRRMYFVRDRLGVEDVKPIALHELGHALGSDHEKDEEGNVGKLMYPHYKRGSFLCVDYGAMEKVAAYQGLDKNKLNYCRR